MKRSGREGEEEMRRSCWRVRRVREVKGGGEKGGRGGGNQVGKE